MPARRSLLRLASLPLLGGLLFWLAASPAQAEACDPTKACCGGSTPGGATCGGEGAASQGNNSGTNQGAGNPINVITGNKFQQETDLPALPGVLGLEIVRYYNSQYSLVPGNKGILGRGWRLSYETTLQDLGDSVRIVQADGTPVLFRRGLLEPDRYRSGDPQQGVLSLIRQAGRKRYAWRWPNGRVLSFDEAGRLERISAPSGEAVSLSYDPRGALIRVVDPQGRALQLNYHDAAGGRYAGVRSIDSPVGRFAYAYGSPAPRARRRRRKSGWPTWPASPCRPASAGATTTKIRASPCCSPASACTARAATAASSTSGSAATATTPPAAPT
ncbi:DUF6531 domain-containing protein [Chitinimonas koreensis]|uniref:DUF6531 domain-containing protein n=1 Tax=Chitinimonas koreensis TaxID=356302 RepID=UPI00223FD6BC|nr:DUF6531 domain-containing protein [Chitinimonas koreensis]